VNKVQVLKVLAVKYFFGGWEMKKVILVLLIVIGVTVAVSAQTYMVQEVNGRVEREVGNNSWELIKVGDTLRAEMVIRTAISNANLTVTIGNEVLVVGPRNNGKLGDLVGNASVINIGGKVAETDTSAVNRRTTRVSTASARASSAATEIEVEEE